MAYPRLVFSNLALRVANTLCLLYFGKMTLKKNPSTYMCIENLPVKFTLLVGFVQVVGKEKMVSDTAVQDLPATGVGTAPQ